MIHPHVPFLLNAKRYFLGLKLVLDYEKQLLPLYQRKSYFLSKLSSYSQTCRLLYLFSILSMYFFRFCVNKAHFFFKITINIIFFNDFFYFLIADWFCVCILSSIFLSKIINEFIIN